MTRNAFTPALRAREERVDVLLGEGEDRALRASDLDEIIADKMLAILARRSAPLGEALPPAVVLRPAPGIILGTALQAGQATGTPSANQERIMPFSLPFDLPVDQMGISISAGIAAALCKITVYGTDAAGRPQKILHETANIPADVAGTFMVAADMTFQRGRAYFVGVRSSAAITYRTIGSNSYAALSWTTAATPAPSGALVRNLTYATPATDWVYSAADHQLAAPALVLLRAA